MRWIYSFALLFTTSFSLAQSDLKDYGWNLTEITQKHLSKEQLYSGMDRKFVRVNSSICSNRAHMWANDFKRNYNLDTAKIFLFFTPNPDQQFPMKVWWYHVAPMVKEKGTLFVLDPIFGKRSLKPLLKEEWLKVATNYENCREIKANETELIELMFTERTFPRETAYGYNPCYYKIVPHTFWTPGQVAMNLLGRDRSGKPVRLERAEINKSDLYQACIEATAGKLGSVLGSKKKECERYVER